MSIDLHDGTRVHVRPIRAGDKALLEEGLARLSAETVRRRFMAAKPRLSAGELRYLTEIDGHDHIAFVAVLDADPGQMVAVARSVHLAGTPDTAEMAIVVGDEWQGLGLGSALAERLAEAARDAGIRRLAAVMLAENEPARRLMLRIARRLAGDEPAVVSSGIHDGVRELTVELAG